MEHVIVKLAAPHEVAEMRACIRESIDGELFDLDVLEHRSTFNLCAFDTGQHYRGFLPVQRPAMIENFVRPPFFTTEQNALALTRLVEYSIGEAYRRDVGEIYFLTRDADTAKFAQRHHFKLLPDGLQVFRLNLLETFGS